MDRISPAQRISPHKFIYVAKNSHVKFDPG